MTHCDCLFFFFLAEGNRRKHWKQMVFPELLMKTRDMTHLWDARMILLTNITVVRCQIMLTDWCDSRAWYVAVTQLYWPVGTWAGHMQDSAQRAIMKSLDNFLRQPVTTVNLRELATAAGLGRGGEVGRGGERGVWEGQACLLSVQPCEAFQYCEIWEARRKRWKIW